MKSVFARALPPLMVAAAIVQADPATAQEPLALHFSQLTNTKEADGAVVSAGEPLLPGTRNLIWRLPTALPPGNYWVEFSGNANGNPVEWVNSRGVEKEPYRLKTGTSAKDVAVAAFTFPVPDAPTRLVSEYRHKQLDLPLLLTRRRSDHLLSLKPGEFLALETRSAFALTGTPTLRPAGANSALDLDLSTSVAHHLFDTTRAPQFTAAVKNLGESSNTAQLRITWLDCLQGPVKSETRKVDLAPGETKDLSLSWTPPFGAYTLRCEMLGPAGQLLLRQDRHFTYSPFVDNKTLPKDWPFAWHLRLFEPPMPPVGFQWQRVFLPWYEMEPKRGEFNWKEMDEIVARARTTNSRLLYIFEGTPRWASMRPELPGQPNREKHLKTYWGYPPTDWQYARDFLRAFWARYAPGGDTSLFGAIEVINEPNAGHSVDYTYAQYTELCKIVHEETQRLAPRAKVVGISQSGGLHMWWVNGVIEAGAGRWMDAASTHNYEINAPIGPVSIASKNGKMRAALDAKGFTQIPIWNTEAGVSSWGRSDGLIVPETLMNERARKSPNFNPAQPEKIGSSWRTSNEWVAACNMVRSSAQNISMGVTPIFYFKWQAGNFSWVHDWQEGGNVIPKLMIPVQAVQSQLWMRYASRPAPPLALESPSKHFVLFAHRFQGPEGRLTVLYAHPRRGGFVVQDDVAAGAPGAAKGEPVSTPEEGERVINLPPYSQKLFDVPIPGLIPGAVTMDILARNQTPLKIQNGSARVGIAQAPVYLIEPRAGQPVWPTTPSK